MPHKGYKHTEEARKNMSLSRTGVKRKPFTEEHKANMRNAKRMPFTEKHKANLRKKKITYRERPGAKGRISPMKGKKFSEEHKRKISESHRGEKSYNWKGGITEKCKAIRNGIDFRLWREAVFARDNWICQKTGERGGKLHPHHIQNFAQFPELRFAIDNGITLSEKAHIEFHKRYGKKNNTQEQIYEFLKGR